MKLRSEHPVWRSYGPDTSVMSSPLVCSNDGAGSDAGGGGVGGGGDSQPAAITAPWAGAAEGKPWMIGEAGKEQPWYNAIPEGPVREHAKAKGFSTPAEAVMSNYNLTRIHTGNGNVVEIPGTDATQEAKDKFYTTLGRPTDATKYDFSKAWADDTKVNPDFKPNDNFIKFGQGLAFKLGLSTQQGETLASEYRTYEREQEKTAAEALRTANDTEVAALKTTYGAEYDTHIAAGKRAYEALGLPEKTVAALEKNMGDAAVIDLLCRLGMKSAEGGFKSNNGGGGGPGGGPGGAPGSMTPEQAGAEITRLRGDQAFQTAFNNRNDPGHKGAVERLNQLYAKAGPHATA